MCCFLKFLLNVDLLYFLHRIHIYFFNFAFKRALPTTRHQWDCPQIFNLAENNAEHLKHTNPPYRIQKYTILFELFTQNFPARRRLENIPCSEVVCVIMIKMPCICPMHSLWRWIIKWTFNELYRSYCHEIYICVSNC